VRFSVVRAEAEAIPAAARIGYPLIIKPVRGVAKSLTAIARTEADVRRYFDELGEASAALQGGLATHLDHRYLLEEYAAGRQYAVEVAANGGGTVALVASAQKKSARIDLLEMGYTVPSGLEPGVERELGAYAESVCTAMGLDLGIFHVEVILTDRGPRLVEVNPRIAGGGLPQTIGAVGDRDLFAVLVDIFAGDDDCPVPLTISNACSHSVLGAVSATTVGDDVPEDWLDEFADRIHSGWTRVGPGARVPAMRGNFDPIGLIRAIGLNSAEAEELCQAVKADVSARLGVALIEEAGSCLDQERHLPQPNS
jgi:biotin carboxylase